MPAVGKRVVGIGGLAIVVGAAVTLGKGVGVGQGADGASVGRREGERERGTEGPTEGSEGSRTLVGQRVYGLVSNHVMVTPRLVCVAAFPTSASDTKRMNMLPDVATWMSGIIVPLNWPFFMPVVDVPS